MIRGVLEKLGVDYRQWRALVKMLIRRDFRESSMPGALRHGRTGRRSFFTLIFFYLLTGTLFVPIVLTNRNIFMSATLLISYTMFMLASLVLVEYHTVVVSADDYTVLGYRPISSRTFFVVKLTNLCFYVLTFSTVLAFPALVAFFFVPGFTPLLGLTSLAVLLMANFTAALLMVDFYAGLLKRISMQRLKNALAFFQVGLAFVIYSSFFVLPKLMEPSFLRHLNLHSAPWLGLLPPTWFASFVRILHGDAGGLEWVLAMLSLVLVAVSAYFAFSKLSLDYAQDLVALTEQGEKTRAPRRKLVAPFLLFAHAHEERVVAKLIRNQFLHDNKFKMAVLGILPLTVFYLFIGIESGPLPDPFVTAEFAMSRSGLLYLLIFLFPMMLRTYVTQSDAYEASWILYTTPTDIRRLVLAEKNFLMIYFVLPFLFILGCVFFYYFRDLLHALLHILAMGLLSHLFLQFAFLYAPDLPFSRPNVRGSRSRNLALFLVLVPFLLYFVLPLVFRYVYTHTTSYLTFVATILVVSVVLESLIKVRVSVHMRKFEFPG